MSDVNRRYFLMSSGLAAAVPLAARASSPNGANNRVRVAIIGVKGRGGEHIRGFSALSKDNVELAALCDVDESVLNQRLSQVEEKSGKKPAAFTDMRKVFDDKSIDVVSFATPNHWHALGTIWACQAGKDVYVEKPASHNIFEGRQMVAAHALREAERQAAVDAFTDWMQRPDAVQTIHEAAVLGRRPEA